MIAALTTLALGWGWKSWAAKLFGRAVPVLLLAAIAAGGYALIFHAGETAGGAKVTAKVTEQHGQAVTDARHDEHAAQSSAATIGAAITAKNNAASSTAVAAQETIHAQISALPVAPSVDAGPARADTGVLDASLDALVDRANRAAAAADAR
ncbi:MAG: hypothetical protein ACTHM0_13290 [Sphingomonas sp.]